MTHEPPGFKIQSLWKIECAIIMHLQCRRYKGPCSIYPLPPSFNKCKTNGSVIQIQNQQKEWQSAPSISGLTLAVWEVLSLLLDVIYMVPIRAMTWITKLGFQTVSLLGRRIIGNTYNSSPHWFQIANSFFSFQKMCSTLFYRGNISIFAFEMSLIGISWITFQWHLALPFEKNKIK